MVCRAGGDREPLRDRNREPRRGDWPSFAQALFARARGYDEEGLAIERACGAWIADSRQLADLQPASKADLSLTRRELQVAELVAALRAEATSAYRT